MPSLAWACLLRLAVKHEKIANLKTRAGCHALACVGMLTSACSKAKDIATINAAGTRYQFRRNLVAPKLSILSISFPSESDRIMTHSLNALCCFSLFVAATLSLLVSAARGQQTTSNEATAIESTANQPIVAVEEAVAIDRAIQLQTGGGFWGAVLVAVKGKIILAKGYGNADYLSQPNTADTLFDIASISKPFTSAAILRLEELDKLSTDDPLTKFFPNCPADKQEITVYQLLTHTSGLRADNSVPYNSPMSRDEFVDHIFSFDVAHQPGAQFEYNNPAYAILAAIVEVAAGESFEEFSRRELFQKSGMLDSGFIGDLHLDGKLVTTRLTDNTRTATDWNWGWGYRGMGGVVSTVNDLNRWHNALREGKILKAPTLKKYYRPHQANYACGWEISESPDGSRRVSHSGGVRGYRNIFERNLTDDSVIIVLSNDSGNPHEIAKLIREVLSPPLQTSANLDASPYELNEHRAATVPVPIQIEVTQDSELATMRMIDGNSHQFASISLPLERANGLAKLLRRRLANKGLANQKSGKPPVITGNVYLNSYPGSRFELQDSLTLELQVTPSSNTASLILKDAKNSMWPIMMKLNLSAAESLAEAIEKQ